MNAPDVIDPGKDAKSRPAFTRWLLVLLVSVTVLLSSLTPVDRLAETEFKALFQPGGRPGSGKTGGRFQ